MGMIVQTPEQYEASLRKLFPRGSYWDRQFADSESDCSLFCKAKVDEFIRFKNRMSDLQNESAIQSASETLDDWERVLRGSVAAGFTTEQRRMRLIASKASNITPSAIKRIAQIYGVTITDIQFPFRSAFFGFSRFGIDQITSPASFSTLFIYASAPEDEEIRTTFEKMLESRLLANYILYFIYDT